MPSVSCRYRWSTAKPEYVLPWAAFAIENMQHSFSIFSIQRYIHAGTVRHEHVASVAHRRAAAVAAVPQYVSTQPH